MSPSPARLRIAWCCALAATFGVVAACASDPVAPAAPGDGVGVATTSLTTTTFQDLDDLVHATDRQPVPTLPAGDGAALDVLGQVRAIVAMIERRDGIFTGEAGPLVDAIGQELVAAFSGCDVEPTVAATTTGVGPAIGTIDITIGCDPTTDRVQYVLTLAQPGSVENATEGWIVTAATRRPHCTRGVSDGLCA